MPYADVSALFRQEKVKFSANMNKSQLWWDAEAAKATHSFLEENNSLIEQEFQHLFAVLKKYDKEILLINQKLEQASNLTDASICALRERKAKLVTKNIERQDFWLQCYYYARLLESYNNAYGKANKYGKWSNEIYQRFNTPAEIPLEEKKAWATRILDDLTELATVPWHIGKIRDWISFANIYRIHTVFCRLTAKTALLLASEQKLLDMFKSVLNWQFNISALDAPTNVYNVLSVGLFAVRFMINFGLLLKHTVNPSKKEAGGKPWYEEWHIRFFQELNKRYCNLLNDICWGSVNLISNFGPYLHLSSALGNGLTAGFLCFDVALLAWRRKLEEDAYFIKRDQYLHELGLNDVASSLTMSARTPEQHMLKEQLIQLQIQWEAKSAMYLFDIAAALVLVTSFSGVLLLTSPAIITPLCFFAITLGAAMYISDGAFKAYWEKKTELKYMPYDELSTPESIDMVHEELNAAWRTLLVTFIKNATIPLFITAAFTVSTPIALLMSGLYIAYENGQAYFERPEPLAAGLLITGACFISWPLALTMTVLYGGYEAGRWVWEQPGPGTSPTHSM